MVLKQAYVKPEGERFRFAWLPTKMDNGAIVWMERYLQSAIFGRWTNWRKEQSRQSWERLEAKLAGHESDQPGTP